MERCCLELATTAKNSLRKWSEAVGLLSLLLFGAADGGMGTSMRLFFRITAASGANGRNVGFSSSLMLGANGCSLTWLSDRGGPHLGKNKRPWATGWVEQESYCAHIRISFHETVSSVTARHVEIPMKRAVDADPRDDLAIAIQPLPRWRSLTTKATSRHLVLHRELQRRSSAQRAPAIGLFDPPSRILRLESKERG